MPEKQLPLELRRLDRVRRRGARRSSLIVFAILFAVYVAGIGLHGTRTSDLRVSEAHVLLTTESIVSGGDFELTDEYRRRAWKPFYRGALTPTALAVNGRLLEPQGHRLRGERELRRSRQQRRAGRLFALRLVLRAHGASLRFCKGLLAL